MKSYWVNIICNLIPVFVVLILSALWFVNDLSYHITFWQLLFVTFVMPICLSIINILYAIKNNKYLFVHKIIFMIALQVISVYVGFWAWKMTSSQGYVDSETLMIVNFELQVSTFIILITGVVFQIVRVVKYRSIKNNDFT